MVLMNNLQLTNIYFYILSGTRLAVSSNQLHTREVRGYPTLQPDTTAVTCLEVWRLSYPPT